MAFTGFTASDFKVFDLKGFQPRMVAIRAGPEFADKKRWAAAWKESAGRRAPALKKAKGPEEIARLGDEPTRTRDGQFVLGRLVSESDAAAWGPNEYTKAAATTFEALAPLYRLRS